MKKADSVKEKERVGIKLGKMDFLLFFLYFRVPVSHLLM